MDKKESPEQAALHRDIDALQLRMAEQYALGNEDEGKRLGDMLEPMVRTYFERSGLFSNKYDGKKPPLKIEGDDNVDDPDE